MKTKYKYIRFEKRVNPWDEEYVYWRCSTIKHRELLGSVVYYQLWKQYCFMPEGEAVFSSDCLEDIQDFLKQLQAKDQS